MQGDVISGRTPGMSHGFARRDLLTGKGRLRHMLTIRKSRRPGLVRGCRRADLGFSWMRPGRGVRALAAAGVIAVAAGSGAVPAQAAAGYPLPVTTVSGQNYDTPDPGVLLYKGTFYGFSTDGGLREWTAPEAGGPWTTPADVLVRSSLPGWVDTAKGIWGPHMIQTTSGTFVVYFSAALNGTAGNPPGSDAKPASGARCIGTATSPNPTGPFSVAARPLVCFTQYGAADTMTGDPGNRVLGEGALASQPSFVTINGQRELFLVYKTQGDPGQPPQQVTIRMVRLADADGTTVLGDSHQLLSSGTGSFLDTIEVQALVQNGSWFILFVAHGNWDSCNYSTEWFKSQHIWAWQNNGGTTLLTSAGSGLCGPGDADVTASEVAGQDRIFVDGWVQESSGRISTIPLGAGTPPQENVNAARVMYAAILRFASDGYTPVIGEYLGQ